MFKKGKTPSKYHRLRKSSWPILKSLWMRYFLPSLKLTWHLKNDGWKTTFLLGRPIFRGKLLVSGSVLHIQDNVLPPGK